MIDRSPQVGILLMVLAMLIMPVSDGIVKILSEDYDILFLNWARFFIGAVIFVPFAIRNHRRNRTGRGEFLSLFIRTVLHIRPIGPK